jgi:hypothetical protein
MGSARTAVLDRGAETILVVCPADGCMWRLLGTEEVALRRSLLRHFQTDHDKTDSIHRETQRRWLARNSRSTQ